MALTFNFAVKNFVAIFAISLGNTFQTNFLFNPKYVRNCGKNKQNVQVCRPKSGKTDELNSYSHSWASVLFYKKFKKSN